jgi:hypothetical protein
MKNKLRHSLYWVAVGVGLPFILFAIGGTELNERLEPLYGKFRSWTHQDRYGRRNLH